MEVTFSPISKEAELYMPPPRKAADYLPQWYKDAPLHEPGHQGSHISNILSGSTMTVKGCSPFLDTLISGYVFELAADVEFQFREDGLFVPKWMADYKLISAHPPYQAGAIPKRYEPNDGAYKWHSGWIINTPPGYSTLFTHPLNRNDLPFQTLSGIVETDTYGVETNFPFHVLNPDNKDYMVIEKGTPICQAIPFKRDDWESEILPFDEDKYNKSMFQLRSKLDRSYRNQHWIRKLFK
jgi:Family of unknown function (DUF6065)